MCSLLLLLYHGAACVKKMVSSKKVGIFLETCDSSNKIEFNYLNRNSVFYFRELGGTPDTLNYAND